MGMPFGEDKNAARLVDSGRMKEIDRYCWWIRPLRFIIQSMWSS